MLAEAEKIPGAGAAGVDKGGRSTAPHHRLCLDPHRRSTPIDVRVEIDHPTHHDLACLIDPRRASVRRYGPLDGRDPIRGKTDTGDDVEPSARIEHPAALQDQVNHAMLSSS